jgi:hypothetical protein
MVCPKMGLEKPPNLHSPDFHAFWGVAPLTKPVGWVVYFLFQLKSFVGQAKKCM